MSGWSAAASTGSKIIQALGNFALNQWGSALSSKRQYQYTRKMMYLQDVFNRNWVRDYYGLNRESLERAGYNPLLALNGGAPTWSPTASASATDSDSGTQAVDSSINASSALSQIDNTQESTKLITKQIEGQEIENGIKELQRKKLKSDIDTSPKTIVSELISGDKEGTINKYVNTIEKAKNYAKGMGIDLPDIPNNSAKTNQHTSSKVKQVVNLANSKSSVAKASANAMLANPAIRALVIGAVGYKTFKHIYNQAKNHGNYKSNKKPDGQGKGYSFDYIPDSELK